MLTPCSAALFCKTFLKFYFVLSTKLDFSSPSTSFYFSLFAKFYLIYSSSLNIFGSAFGFLNKANLVISSLVSLRFLLLIPIPYFLKFSSTDLIAASSLGVKLSNSIEDPLGDSTNGLVSSSNSYYFNIS